MKTLRIASAACLVTLLLVILGCGGGGGGSSSSGGGDGSGKTLAYDHRGFSGTLVNTQTASSTPQTVQVNVSGDIRTVSNVIVPRNMTAGSHVTVFSEGSRILNVSIPNAGEGLSIDTFGVKAPVASDGTLNAGIVVDKHYVNVVTPSATWQGYSMPNGIGLSFYISADNGDARTQVNTKLKLASSPGTLTGTANMVYTSPATVSFGVSFASNLSGISLSASGPAGTDRTVTAPWSTIRANSDALVFTTARIDSTF